jgi:hypothetical protein
MVVMLIMIPVMLAAITILTVPVQSSDLPFIQTSRSSIETSSTFQPTFQPTVIYVQVTTTTQTLTTSSQITITETTASVQSVTERVTQTRTESFTATSTTAVGFVPGFDPNMNHVILALGIVAGLLAGVGVVQVARIRPAKIGRAQFNSGSQTGTSNRSERCGEGNTHCPMIGLHLKCPKCGAVNPSY